MILAAVIALSIVAVMLVSVAGHLARIADALAGLARIAIREHSIREQERAQADEAKVAMLERGGPRR